MGAEWAQVLTKKMSLLRAFLSVGFVAIVTLGTIAQKSIITFTVIPLAAVLFLLELEQWKPRFIDYR